MWYNLESFSPRTRWGKGAGVRGSAIVVVLFVALCSGALALDRKLPARSTATEPTNRPRPWPG